MPTEAVFWVVYREMLGGPWKFVPCLNESQRATEAKEKNFDAGVWESLTRCRLKEIKKFFR